MRKIILGVILLLVIIFLFSHLAEFKNIFHTIQRGDLRFFLLALVIQAAWFINVSAAYESIYRLVGSEVNRLRLLRLAITSDFINILVPSLGMSGITMFASDARQRGDSPAAAVVAGVIWTLCEYYSFIFVLAFGLTLLALRSDLHWSLLLASSFLLIATFGLTFLLYMGLHSVKTLGDILSWAARMINRFMVAIRKSPSLSEQNARAFAAEAAVAIKQLRNSPQRLLVPFLFALANKILLILILALSFRTFRVHFSVSTLVAGFSAGYLFLLASPTPSGIGTFESALILALNSLNVPLAEAAVITLTYRVVTFWFPFLLGISIIRSVTQPKSQPSPDQNSEDLP